MGTDNYFILSGNRRSVRALITGVVLISLNQLSGTFAIMNYSSMIFAATESTLDPNTNTIIIGVVQILGAYTAIICVDRFGRKILMILSSSGMGFGMAILGVYGFINEQGQIDLLPLSWLPLVLMIFIIFIANIGIISLTFVLLIETLPVKVGEKGMWLKHITIFYYYNRFAQLEHLSA